ncbi:MAG: hypothetical protein Q9173_006321 [Seirophora scorigena]
MESAGLLMMAGVLGPAVQKLLMLWTLYNVKHVTQTVFIRTTLKVPFDTTSAPVLPSASSIQSITATAASRAIAMLPTSSPVASIASPVAFVTPPVTPVKALVNDNSSGFFDALFALILGFLNIVCASLGRLLTVVSNLWCSTLESGSACLVSSYNALSTHVSFFFRACLNHFLDLRDSTHWGSLRIVLGYLVCITLLFTLMYCLGTHLQQPHQPPTLHAANAPQPQPHGYQGRNREVALLISLHLGAAFVIADLIFELAWPTASPVPTILALLPYGRSVSLIVCAILASLNWRLVLHFLASVPDWVDDFHWHSRLSAAVPWMESARRLRHVVACYWRSSEPYVTWALKGVGHLVGHLIGVIGCAIALGVYSGVAHCLRFFLTTLTRLDFSPLTSAEKERDSARFEADLLRETKEEYMQRVSSFELDKDQLASEIRELSDYKAQIETAKANGKLKKQTDKEAEKSERERVRKVEESNEELQLSNETLRSTNKRLETQVKIKGDRILSLVGEAFLLQQRIRRRAQDTPRGSERRENAWKAVADDHANEVKTWKRRSDVQSAEIDDLREQLDARATSAELEVAQMRLELDNLKHQLHDQASAFKVPDQQAEVEALKKELEAVNNALSLSKTQHEATNDALSVAQKSIGVITAEHEAARAFQISQKDSQHEATKRALDQAKRDLSDLEQKNDLLHGEKECLERQNAQLRQVNTRTRDSDRMDVDELPVVGADERRLPVMGHDEVDATEAQPMDGVTAGPVSGGNIQPGKLFPRRLTLRKKKCNNRVVTAESLAPRSGDASEWSPAELQAGQEDPKLTARRLRYKQTFPRGHVPLPSTLDPLNSSLAALKDSIEHQMPVFTLQDGELLTIYTEHRTAINEGLTRFSQNGVLSDGQLMRILRRWGSKYNLYPILGIVSDFTEEGPRLAHPRLHADSPPPQFIWLYKRLHDRNEERNREIPWLGLRPRSLAETNVDAMVL